MVNKIRFAIIGCGRIGERHAEHISKLGTLVAVCDLETTKAEKISTQFSGKIYSNIEDLLQHESANIDVVSICTPNGLHAHHAILGLNAGCHILCEKPMATTVVDCKSMIAAAEINNKYLFAIKQNRFNPPVVAVKKALDENRLGKIFSIQLNCFWNRNEDYYKNSWKGTKDLDGGTLFTQFSHFIDLLFWMIGDVKSVYAKGKNYSHKSIIEFEDTGVVLLEFENGVLGTINYTVNAFEKNMEGSLTIFGENGTVKIGGQYLNELEYQSIKDYIIKDLPAGNLPNNYGNYIGSMSNHNKVYQNVIDVLQNNAAISTSAHDGLKTVEIIEMIYKSMEENGGSI